jgi:ribulose-5-phosphate 4-epimerase/fuculose-1-phosphate aldolase
MDTVPSQKDILRDKLMRAAAAARELYRRGEAFGPDANISFMLDGRVYITRRDCPFRRAASKDFACVTMAGKPMNNVPACEELPLHLALYHRRGDIGAVIHAHSTYATLWSCLEHEDLSDVIPAHTPHLSERAGKVGMSGGEEPDSSKVYLLKNHGAVVGGKDVTDALFNLYQLEESAKLAWIMRRGTV